MTDDTDGRYDEDDQQVPHALVYAEERAADAYTAWRDTSTDERVPTWEQLDPFVRRCMIGQEADRMAAASQAGAVAAAPPGDEDGRAVDRATDDVHVAVAECGDGGEAQRTRQRLCDGWRLVPPAPPAGHEDEAAVERAAWSAEDRRDVSAWLLREADERAHTFPQRRDGVDALLRALARAALAAARGPRTPDPGAGA